MLTLYVKKGCPYCERVLTEAEVHGIALNTKDVADPVILAELIQKGGKRQMPYLVDDERQVSMYESMDITQYLHDHYENEPTVA